MTLISPSHVRALRSSPLLERGSGRAPHVLLADPDPARAQRIAAGFVELGWRCEVATTIWEALGLIEALRFTHLVARLHQMSPDDLGGMLLAWTWLRSGRRQPIVLGNAPELAADPSVQEQRVVSLPDEATPSDIWARLAAPQDAKAEAPLPI